MKLYPRSLKSLLLSHETVLLLLVVVTGAMGAMWAYFWLQSSRESVRINALLYEAQQVRGDLYSQLREVLRARILEDPAALLDYENYAQAITGHFARLDQNAQGEKETIAIDYMRQSYRTVSEDMDKIFANPYLTSDSVRLKVLDPLYEEWMLAEFESALLIFDRIIAAQRQTLESNLERWTGLAPFLIAIPIALAIILLLFSRRSLGRGFVQPMRALTVATQRISAGQLDQAVPEQGVAEVAQLAQTFNTMRQDLLASRDALAVSERQAAQGALVPVVAHNIRNPLASIRAAAQLLEEPTDAAELAETRSAIIDTVDRLERWVSALLAYLHPLKLNTRRVALTAVVEGALAPLQSKLTLKNIQVQKPVWVTAQVEVDADLLEQALYGLLNNAVDASPPGSELILMVDRRADEVVLSIDDDGPGMPFDPQPGPLSPGPTTKRFGTGLGIPFAFKVCEAHSAKLAFSARAEGGTRVALHLPVVAIELS